MVDKYLRWQAKGFAKTIAKAESNSSDAYFFINFLSSIGSFVDVQELTHSLFGPFYDI